MEFELLKDVVLILALAILVLFIFHKLKLPSVIGLLLTGVITGPHGLHLISDIHQVEVLAEIGVILLLFTIGLEFSLKSLYRIRKIMLVGGSFQVILTIGGIFLISKYMGNPINESIFIGFLIALSSTAIVLKLLQDKGEIESAHGRLSLGTLIFQDIIIVPMMLITPILAGNTEAIGGSYWEIILKFALVAVVIFMGAKYILPFTLHQIARTQNRELFLLSIIVLAFAIAFFTYSLGLSLALGAFIAGLLISESEYSQQAMGNVIPFLDVFTSFFFISIGMLLDVSFLMEYPIEVLLFTTLVLSFKALISGGASFILGFPLRTCIIVGFTLSQVGEFSFILSRIGMSEGLLSEENYQLFLNVSVMSMAATPFVINLATRTANKINDFPLPNFLKFGLSPKPESTIGKVKDHVIIIGYGINGKNVARAAKFANISHVIIEINPDTVRKERQSGEIIHFGDATQEEVLSHANIEEAMILVITIPITGEASRIIRMARRMNPHVHIILRARFISDMKDYYELGADEVIPEEFETSIEIFTRMLAKYLIPHEEIEKLVTEVRADGYEMFRKIEIENTPASKLSIQVPEVEINTIHVCENAPIIGKSLKDMNYFHDEKITLLAVSRISQVFSKLSGSFIFEENDILFFLGSSAQITDLSKHFREPDPDEYETNA